MQDIVLTLAAMAQAIKQVESIAWKGRWNELDAEPLLKSVFNMTPTSVIDLYQGSATLTNGLRTIRNQLDSTSSEKDTAFGKYLANLLSIQKQFLANPSVQAIVDERLEHTKRLLELDSVTSTGVIASLAECYSQSISTLTLRVQVHGEPQYLQDKSNQERIRALLLAAVRAAVLWRQIGGKKRQFLFNRKELLSEAQKLLTHPVFPSDSNNQ